MRRPIIFFLILFSFLFAHIYQKVKILTLAYQVRERQVSFDNLVEGKFELVYDFYREANYINISKRLAEDQLELKYPKKYVKLSPQDSKKTKPIKREGVLAKLLSIASRVEAQPQR